MWYDKDQNIVAVGDNPNNPEYTQDEDTLDTWFSSGLWTFSTLGWPNKMEDLKKFHPTQMLETGHDILFFWVARMVLFSKYVLNQIPFENVYLHGLIRDKEGRKMSKSIGNVLDPRELSDKFGTDALRMALIVGNGPGNDLKLSEDKVKAYKLFANKIWNATRFVFEKCEGIKYDTPLNEIDANLYKVWQEKLKEITSDIEEYKLHIASEKIYDYFWKTFCDVIIETHKLRIQNNEDADSAKVLLMTILRENIITLHPFMPFITEELWQYFENQNKDLIIEPWPIQ